MESGQRKFGAKIPADRDAVVMLDQHRRPVRRRSPYRVAAFSIGVILLGAVVGLMAAIVGGKPSIANVTQDNGLPLYLAHAPAVVAFEMPRPVLAEYQIAAPERLSPWLNGSPPPPKIVIVFDDIGLDRQAFEEIMGYPGPLTLSFLPYGKNLQPMVDRAKEAGNAVLLHLPMEPEGNADPGPHALKTGVSGLSLLEELDWNLNRFKGFTGVNNHMGSRFTRSEAHMKTVLSILKDRNLYFLDSVTTGKSAVPIAAQATGITTLYRDVFLDATPGTQNVRQQLARLEKIAIKTGFAVAICHPRKDTLDVLGPWLTSAPARGFELATLDELHSLTRRPSILAQN